MTKVVVSQRAVLQRINRKLAKDDRKLCKSRGWRVQSSLGDYYILDTYKNVVTDYRISNSNIEDMAREMGALREYEEMEEA